ncbi:hypothetical protein HK105_208940 [Polyrhizophydium stewartii]|uniref:Uncharacterized protein n=1 Tax=Polyrhizophydium stewartii TaxID=2732419 RepID=A0ABR4MWI1_9FUNG
MSIASVQHGRVFGIKNDIPDNIYYVEENTILYPAGSNIIIDNVEQQSIQDLCQAIYPSQICTELAPAHR